MGKGAGSPQAVWHSLLWDWAVSREKNNGKKKICLSLLILCLVSESGCISFALCNHSQSKHGMKLFFDQTQYFYFNVLLFEVFSAEFLQIYTATADFIRWERRGKSHWNHKKYLFGKQQETEIPQKSPSTRTEVRGWLLKLQLLQWEDIIQSVGDK